MRVSERSSARLSCAVQGAPQPRVRWLLNGQELRYDGLRTFLGEDGSTLSIEDVSARDAGQYTCEAHNGIGEPIRRSVNLYVQGECRKFKVQKILNKIQ